MASPPGIVEGRANACEYMDVPHGVEVEAMRLSDRIRPILESPGPVLTRDVERRPSRGLEVARDVGTGRDSACRMQRERGLVAATIADDQLRPSATRLRRTCESPGRGLPTVLPTAPANLGWRASAMVSSGL